MKLSGKGMTMEKRWRTEAKNDENYLINAARHTHDPNYKAVLTREADWAHQGYTERTDAINHNRLPHLLKRR